MKKFVLASLLVMSTSAFADEKHHEDPTRIITKVGASWDSDGHGVKGSIGLDETRMINGSYRADGSWRIGGSWLTDYGILNFNFDDNEDRKTYSVGTFVPLNVFDVDTGKWMVFPMGGVNYTEAKEDDWDSTSYYLGAFAIRPIDEHWSFMTFGVHVGGDAGADVLGAGMSYKLADNQSVNFFGKLVDEKAFESENKLSVSYTYEF